MLKKKTRYQKGNTASVVSVPVEYSDLNAVEALLGTDGMNVLIKTIKLIDDAAQQENWPLTKIEVEWVQDYELKSWEYIWIILFFDSNFDQADQYLHQLYPKIDEFETALTEEEQSVLQKKLFFDVRPSLS